MSPFSIILLSAEAHRKREAEEQARSMISQTTMQDHKHKKKFAPKLVLKFNLSQMFLKCY